MRKSENPPIQIGQMVMVRRGRDSGKVAVVIEVVNERFVLLADGDKRKFDRPKRKNLQHVQTIDYISTEVVESLNESGRVTNAKLRYAVNKYLQEQPSDGKGE